MRAQVVITLIVGTFAAAPAFADMPPPATYVETCTVSQQQKTGSECLSCSAYYGDINRCSKLLAAYCYTKVCKTWGASAWSEILCRTSDPGAPVVPSDVIAILGSATTAAPSDSAADGGMPATCALYPPVVSTSTQTSSSTATEPAQDTSGCSVAAGTSAFRALGPLGLVLAGLALFLLRRRPRC